MERYLEAGKIVNTQGVKGEIKIEPWADSAAFLRGFKFLYIDGQPAKIVSSRVHNGFLIAKLEGVDDVNAAMPLKNRVVSIDRAEAKLPKGTFFIRDLIGASVVTETGEPLGKIADVLEMPAHKVYVVAGTREILIPAVPEFILNTDVDAGTVTVHLIEGM